LIFNESVFYRKTADGTMTTVSPMQMPGADPARTADGWIMIASLLPGTGIGGCVASGCGGIGWGLNILAEVPVLKMLKASSNALEFTRSAIAFVRKAGDAGEAAVRAVYDIGEKVAIKIGGRTRYPDGLLSGVLSEVKNVRSLSYTSQLRDYAAYASQNGLRFDLYVRPTTVLSGPLLDAIESGAINRVLIP
jgi:hypothetical protein